MNKTLVIQPDIFNDFKVKGRYKGVDFFNYYRPITTVGKIFRKIQRTLCFRVDIWFDQWVEKLYQYDTIIVFELSKDKHVINYISKKTTSKQRIIFYYWNPIDEYVHSPNSVQFPNIELWSFDKTDCINYQMQYNSTFYFRHLSLPCEEIVYDTYFLGMNKGRKDRLIEIGYIFEQFELAYNFHVIDKTLPKSEQLPYITYSENLSNIAKSNSILDIVQVGQNGITLRVMEAIFHKKKLITTAKEIIYEKFYNSNNIFIIGHDDKDDLPDFLSRPYSSIDDSIIDYYEFNNWISRFNL